MHIPSDIIFRTVSQSSASPSKTHDSASTREAFRVQSRRFPTIPYRRLKKCKKWKCTRAQARRNQVIFSANASRANFPDSANKRTQVTHTLLHNSCHAWAKITDWIAVKGASTLLDTPSTFALQDVQFYHRSC